ncbi:hypothetical protein FQR65_LT07068 [Abscondita terminalis]|nr:hypothetical protein FQR65_LT07068 [Abscondita terminalis]
MDFFIDNTGEGKEEQAISDDIRKIIAEYKESIRSAEANKKPKKKSIFETFEEEIGWNEARLKRKRKVNIDDVEPIKQDVEDLLKKSVITNEFESLHSIPQYEVAEKHRRLLRKKEAAKSKGKKWYGLPATEITKEIKQDLQVLRMRSALDPKRFYKKNDLKVLPKYFQIGKVIDSPLDYYNGRLTQKERKKTLVDELLADAEFNTYNKRKYKEIITDKQKTSYKAWKNSKKINKTAKKKNK